MPDYTPPNSLNADLNFKDQLKPIDSHHLILNFGADSVLDFARIKIRARFKFTAQSTNVSPVDNRGSARIKFKVSFKIQITASFDINHLMGISCRLNASFYKARSTLGATKIPWCKPILRVSNEALFYDQSLVLSAQPLLKYEQADSLARAVKLLHEHGTGLSANAIEAWQTGEMRFIGQRYLHNESIKLRHNRTALWQEMIRRRKTLTFSHDATECISHCFSFEWDKGLEIRTLSSLPWDKAKAIHYRKHAVEPWPEPQLPAYQGDGILNFSCLCRPNPVNLVLNFGADDCIPAIPNQKGWYILNTVNVVRLDTGQAIKVYDGRYGTSRDNWCWTYSLTVPPSEISKLESEGGPVILQISVNGNVHHMLYESKSVSRQFAKETWTLKGRSQSALLSADYSPLRSFLQENERTSVQLCQAEIDRVHSSALLNWQLIDELGWIVENESLTYTNLAPIDVIKTVAEAGGGFIYSERFGNQITIKPKYKKSAWDSMAINDYDKLLPESLVLDHSIDEVELDDFNGITLTNAKNGNTFQVKRTGTAGEVLKETVSNAMFNAVSAGGFAKSELSRFGKVEDHTFTTPINAQFNECIPWETLAFNGLWWGIVDAVNVSFNHKEVKQTVKVERVLNEQ
jgi:hypothetical protein